MASIQMAHVVHLWPPHFRVHEMKSESEIIIFYTVAQNHLTGVSSAACISHGKSCMIAALEIEHVPVEVAFTHYYGKQDEVNVCFRIVSSCLLERMKLIFLPFFGGIADRW